MKSGWQQKNIADLCDIVNGGTPNTGVPAYWGGSYRWITPADMSKRLNPYVDDTQRKITDLGLQDSSAKILPEYSVILSSRAPIGLLVINTAPMATNQGCKGLIPSGQIRHKFLYYYLMSIVDFLNSLGTGATFKELSGGKLGNVPMPFPTLSEQDRIVGILDKAFEGIAAAKVNAEKNLQNADDLFESHLHTVFTQRGIDWKDKRLGDVCTITSTLVDPRKSEFIDLVHVGAGNIVSKTGVLVELMTAREEGLISGKFLFDESMVLYSKIRPYLMKVVRPDFRGLCSADMYPLAPLSGEITRNYLFYLLLSKGFTDYAIQGSARAGMPKVNREHLFGFRTWIPSVQKQKEFSVKLDKLHEETRHLEVVYQKKRAALDELKESLLHQAFTGQL